MTVWSKTLFAVGVLLVLSVATSLLAADTPAGPLVAAGLMAAAIMLAAVGIRRGESVVLRIPRLVGLCIGWALCVLAAAVVASGPVREMASGALDAANTASLARIADAVGIGLGALALILALMSTASLRQTLVTVPAWARIMPLLAVLCVAIAAALGVGLPLILSALSTPSDALLPAAQVFQTLAVLALVALGALFLVVSTRPPIDVTADLVHRTESAD